MVVGIGDVAAQALAYNLANFLRSLILPQEVKQRSLTTLREKLVKIGARIVRHRRYVVFQMAEVAVPEDAVRRDPAADRRSAATGRRHSRHGIASNDRWQPEGRGASMIDRERPNAAHGGPKPRNRRLGGVWDASEPSQACPMRCYDASSAPSSQPSGESRLKSGAGVTAVAADFGANGEVTSSTLQKPVVVVTWGQSGLMAGATIEGAKMTETNP